MTSKKIAHETPHFWRADSTLNLQPHHPTGREVVVSDPLPETFHGINPTPQEPDVHIAVDEDAKPIGAWAFHTSSGPKMRAGRPRSLEEAISSSIHDEQSTIFLCVPWRPLRLGGKSFFKDSALRAASPYR
jgi:hypothetical protein